MLSAWGQLGLFLAKALIIVFFILFVLVMILFLVAKAKGKMKGQLIIHHLNEKLNETKEGLLAETLSKDDFKAWLKERKKTLKAEKKNPISKPRVFVLQFHGDIQASAVESLREEITALLLIAKKDDEIVLKLESGGGMVHSYGLAAAQLKRVRDQKIPLTVIVDKIAASGGYLMATVANRILAAPFAIIGSIGVVFQLPNFHRVLQNNHIDYEQITAGNYKRTLTIFGQNTEEGREKLKEELEAVHLQFKDVIHEFRKDLDIHRIATGEHWLGKKALELKLVDHLSTSDAYLSERSETAEIYEVTYEIKKSLSDKFKINMQQLFDAKSFAPLLPRA